MSTIANFLSKNKRDTTPHFNYDANGNVIVLGETRITSFSAPSTGCLLNPVDGKYYFSARGMGGIGRDLFIYKYNSVTNVIEQEFRITIGYVHYDTHRFLNFDFDDSGNVIGVFEALHATATHGSAIHIWKTSVPCDLSSMRQIGRIPGRWSYPHVTVYGDDNVFIEARGTTSEVSFIRGDIWYWFSTNGGTSFGSPTQLYDSGNEQLPAYTIPIPDSSDPSKICIILNERNNDTTEWSMIAMWRGSFNSHEWTNYDESFSKDVSSSGALTRTETINNCLVANGAADHDINFEGGMIKSDGSAKLLVSWNEHTGVEYIGNSQTELLELRLYVYNSGWEFNNVNVPIGVVSYRGYQRSIRYLVHNESFEDVIFVDRSDNMNVYRKRSYDNFASSQTDTLLLAGNGKYKINQSATNIDTYEDQLLILSYTDGDEFELGDSEEPSDFSDLLVIKL